MAKSMPAEQQDYWIDQMHRLMCKVENVPWNTLFKKSRKQEWIIYRILLYRLTLELGVDVARSARYCMQDHATALHHLGHWDNMMVSDNKFDIKLQQMYRRVKGMDEYTRLADQVPIVHPNLRKKVSHRASTFYAYPGYFLPNELQAP